MPGFLSFDAKTEELPKGSVKEVIDRTVTKFYDKLTPAQLDTISDNYILGMLSEQDRKILAHVFGILK